MQEKEEHREEEEPKENGASSGTDDPSLEEEPPEEELTEEPVTPDEEEDQPADEGEEEAEPVEEAEDEFLDEEAPSRRRGCLVGCVTPIAVAFVIVLVISIIGYSKRDALSHGLLKRIINNTQSDIVLSLGDNDILSALPAGTSEEQITATFEEVKLALKNRRIDREALTEAIEEYWDAVKQRPLPVQKAEEISRLMTNLEGLTKRSNQ